MENQERSKISVVNLSGGYIVPKVTETKGRKRHVEIGIDGQDDFFQTLIKRYETSPTNQACIDGTTDLILGKGIKSKDSEELEDYLYRLTNEEEIRKIVFDYKMFGNAAIQCVFNAERNQIVGFYHLPVDTLRAEKVDDDGNIPGYYYSSDWLDPKVKPVRIPAFGQPEFEDDVQVIYIRKYSPGKFYYGIPDYYSAIQYCAVEEEVSNLHINNILNNFMPSTILNFNSGLPPVEEQYLIENSIKAKFTGTTNAGRFILSFNENPETKTTVEMLRPENLHQQYDFLAEEASRKIMLAHRVTSQMLFGIKTASGWSSNADELKVAYEIFYAMVINPVQSELIKIFQGIMEYNGYNGESLYFSPLIPFGFLAELMSDAGAKGALDIIQNPDEDLPDTEGVAPAANAGTNETQPDNPNETIGYVEGPENEGASLSSQVNENLKNLSGRQYQQLLRIVNQFQKGKINESQAVLMLKSAFGFTDNDARVMLGVDTSNEVQMSIYSDVDWNSWNIDENYETINQ